MDTKRVNEFLPHASAGASLAERMDMGHMEDDFDVAQYRALKKDKLEEQKRLDHEHEHLHMQLEEQVHIENSRLFTQFQQRVNESMQRVFMDIQPAIATAINNQVSIRLEQQRLREEHAANKSTIQQRYHNKITGLMSMPSAVRGGIHRMSSTPSLNGTIRMAKVVPANPTVPSMANVSPSHQSANVPTQARGPVSLDAARAESMAHQQQRMSRTDVPPHHQVPSHLQQPVVPQRILPSDPLSRQSAGPQRVPLPESLSQQRMPTTPGAMHQRSLAHHHMSVESHSSEPRHQNSVAQPFASDSEPRPTEPMLRNDAVHAPSSVSVMTNLGSESRTTTPHQDAKRKATDSLSTDGFSSALKRPRTSDMPFESSQDGQPLVKQSPRTTLPSQIATEKRPPREISFAEVYQDGKAQYKHQIFEYKAGSGRWYIVKCEEHGVHFKFGNPVHGAAKHVHSPQHDMQPKTHDLAIEICGYLVTGCTAELAKLNNDEYQRAIAEDGYEPYNRNLLTKEGRQRTDNHKKTPKVDKEGGDSIHVNGDMSYLKPLKVQDQEPVANVAAPKACHFYQGLWQSNKKWYSLIVLPIRPDGSLREVGLKEKFHELPLMQTVPKCYDFDRLSMQIKGWQPAYEDGELKANRREYPVMFFDKTPWSLGWLPAHKLEELDLDNPPDNVDIRGFGKAREWFAVKMNNRRSWEELKRLGPGEPLPATPEGEADWIGDQGLSLRSADNSDEKSPTSTSGRHQSQGTTDESDGDSSDEEDDENGGNPIKMDISPVPEPEARDSISVNPGLTPDSHKSDVQMAEAPANTHLEHGVSNEAEQSASDEGNTSPSKQSLNESRESTGVELPWQERENIRDLAGLSAILSEHERVRKSAHTAQAKAAAAVREAASRSRDPSEVADAPEAGSDAGSKPQSPATVDYQRSRSYGPSSTPGRPDSHARLAAPGTGRSSEGRKHSDLQNILNPAGTRTDAAAENNLDSYKRFDALMAQMTSESTPLRPASVPMQPGDHQAQLPAGHQVKQAGALPQNSPSLSHILSPPMQSSSMGAPRSASTTPVPNSSGRSTPSIPATASNGGRWQAVRTSSFGPPPQTPRAAFSNNEIDSAKATVAVVTPAASERGDTPSPLSDTKEIFDLSQFRDSALGVRWSRSNSPSAGYLRLAADPVRGVAGPVEAAEDAVPAGIEPAKVSRIEVETEQDRQWVQLVLKDHSEQAVTFETNSASGRLLNANIQGRRFVNWVKKWNPDAELSSLEGSSLRSSMERHSITAEVP